MNDIDTIINENKNLIYSITNYFRDYINKEDLFQVGVIGMLKAYKNYDESLNIKFTTYAYSYILGEMKKYVREDKGLKVSKSISSLGIKIDKAYELLSQKLNRYPSSYELASFLEIPEYMVADVINSRVKIKSIDSPVVDDSKELTLHETIPSKSEDINTLILLRDELSKLDSFEKDLIKKRYFEDQTQSEIATSLGMSQVQVSRSEKKVLTKLKSRLM